MQRDSAMFCACAIKIGPSNSDFAVLIETCQKMHFYDKFLLVCSLWLCFTNAACLSRIFTALPQPREGSSRLVGTFCPALCIGCAEPAFAFSCIEVECCIRRPFPLDSSLYSTFWANSCSPAGDGISKNVKLEVLPGASSGYSLTSLGCKCRNKAHKVCCECKRP